MYRGVALYFIDNNIDYTDENEAKKACDNIDITIKYEGGMQQLILNGNNVTSLIRQEQVGKAASAVAKHLCVREKLVELQGVLPKIIMLSWTEGILVQKFFRTPI